MLEDQLTGGHDLNDSEILGYRHYADGEITIYVEELHEGYGKMNVHIHADAATLLRELRSLDGATPGETSSFEDGFESIELRLNDDEHIEVTGEDTRETPLTLRSEDITRIEDHVQNAKSALRGAGVL
jgi:aminoglycoside phosphotransferase (APT) family kinase protein